MSKLKDRNRQIPGKKHIFFYIPALKWESRPGSFDSVVQQTMTVLKANPHILAKLGWSAERPFVEELVDGFCAKICKDNGWTDYIIEGAAGGQLSNIPFPKTLGQKLASVVGGSRTLISWLTSGADAVPSDISEKRASLCVNCPLNQQGEFTKWFTVPVSNAIRSALNSREQWNLSTSHDSKLNICAGCLCPIKLKIHLPIDQILSKMPKESFDSLAENCWLRTEK